MRLEGFEPSTFGLGPHRSIQTELQAQNAGERIRTSEPTKGQALEACAFDRFATPA